MARKGCVLNQRRSRIAAQGLTTVIATVVLIIWAVSIGSAQNIEKGDRDTYVTDGQRFELSISSNQIGLVTRQQMDVKRIIEMTRRVGVKDIRDYHGQLFVIHLVRPLTRPQLVAMARELRSKNSEMIGQAGLVGTMPGSKDPILATDEFIVRLKDRVGMEAIKSLNESLRVRIITDNPFAKGQILMTLTDDSPELDVFAVARKYSEHPVVAAAYPNFINVFEDRETIPNDTFFGNQWHHRNTGQSGGTVDADADTSWAWDITTGAPGTVIAVIENGGFDTAHPDLTPNLWANPGEIAGNGIDDDGNSLIDDILGWDFAGCTATSAPGCGDNAPTPAATEDHGTAVAGVAAARGANALGVTGSCPNCSLLLLRTGYVSSDWAKSLAFGYAQQNAPIITNSWGGGGATPNTVTAINAAAAAGDLVLFASGNTTANVCTGINQDPRASLAGVMAISSSSNQDRKVVWSGVGNCIDLLSPSHRGYSAADPYTGTLNVTTTDRSGTAGYNNTNPVNNCPSAEPAPPPNSDRDYTSCFGGTSSATPMTAGVVGLVLTANAGMTRQQVQNLLQDTADRIEPGIAAYSDVNGFSNPATGIATHSWGRLNAFEAVQVAAPVALGGKGSVDILLRDNRLDWGNTEQPSNTLFEATRGFIGHWRSMDIKVDAPSYQVAPTAGTFDAFVDETPSAVPGEVNRVFVRVRNRGPITATSVTVKLYWSQFGTALPPLPPDFWTAFPGNSTDPTNKWNSMTCAGGGSSCSISNLAYSGSSAAGTPGDSAQIVQFDFPAPSVDPSLANHFCLLAMVDSEQDPISGDSKSTFVVDSITPNENNVTHRNYHNLDSSESDSFLERFFVRNPTGEPAVAVLRLEAPRSWKVDIEGIDFGKRFDLKPSEERLVTMRVALPERGAKGEVTVLQETFVGDTKLIGGISLGFSKRPPWVWKRAHASLNGLALVGDPATGSVVNYLSDGTGYGSAVGDTFSFAPIQLPDGAKIRGLTCVMRDNTSSGYIQVTLNRGPINSSDPTVPIQRIASAGTTPGAVDAGFVSRSGSPDQSFATVDNSRYGYFFRVDFLDSPAPAGDPPLKLRGCTVEYID